MKSLFTGLLFFLAAAGFGQQLNLPLLGRWDDDAIPDAWYGAYSECWGYAANGKEYAFLASSQGTYFFNITEPTNPVMIEFFRTKDTTALVVNKDYAVYTHYLYAVSDQGENSLQIFDLQYLPDSVVKVYDNNFKSKRCHTLFVEHDRLYMCSNTHFDNSFSAMDIFSLADPVNPEQIGNLSDPGFFNVHEVFVKNDTAYCANGYNGLWIYDITDPSHPRAISILQNYDEHGFCHSAWVTGDGKTMAFTDEDHGKGVKLFDITDIEDPQQLNIFRSNLLQVADPSGPDGSIAHNPYIVGNILLLSYYHDGIQVYDIADPSSPQLIAYYDTHPQNTDYASYRGCWGLYPFLPSGNIIASDMSNGLFIFDGKQLLQHNSGVTEFTLLENPVEDEVNFLYYNGRKEHATVEIIDVKGSVVLKDDIQLEESTGEINLPFNKAATGIYIARIATDSQVHSVKLMKK